MPSASPEDASEADPGLRTRGIALECLAKEPLRRPTASEAVEVLSALEIDTFDLRAAA